MAVEIFMVRLSQNCLRSWWPKENDPHLQILADRLWTQDVVHFLSTRPSLGLPIAISRYADAPLHQTLSGEPFVAEPLFLHRWFRERATRDPAGTFHLVFRLHILLLTVSAATVI